MGPKTYFFESKLYDQYLLRTDIFKARFKNIRVMYKNKKLIHAYIHTNMYYIIVGNKVLSYFGVTRHETLVKIFGQLFTPLNSYWLDRKHSVAVCPKISIRSVDILCTFSKYKMEDQHLHYRHVMLFYFKKKTGKNPSQTCN